MHCLFLTGTTIDTECFQHVSRIPSISVRGNPFFPHPKDLKAGVFITYHEAEVSEYFSPKGEEDLAVCS